LKRRIFSALKILFFLSIGVFFIWIFVRKLTPDQKQEIWASFISANYFWIIVSIILGILSHLIRSLRWNMLLEPMGYKPKLKNTFSAVMIGYLTNTAIPRLGEVTRCGILSKYEKIPLSKSFGTVIVERSLDLVVFAVLFFFNLIMFYDKLGRYVEDRILIPMRNKFDIENNILVIVLISCIVLFILFFIFRKRIQHLKIYHKSKEIIHGFWHGLWVVTKIERPFTFILYTLLIWFLYYMMIYVCFFTMPQTNHLGFDVALSLLMFGSIGIIVVQGGIGIYPAIIAETLILYDVPTTYGYTLGWLGWTAQTLMIVITGLVCLVLLPLINKSKEYEKA